MKKNSKCQVRADHKFHPSKVGYYQFMGGPNLDALVLAEEPTFEGQYSNTFFAVKPEHIV